MDLNDLRSVPMGTEISADVCVVGSGPAGLTLARELSGSGIRVVLLESGGLDENPWSDALGEIESIGAPRVMEPRRVRNRGLGGSTATWSGRLATFDAVDFAERSWVPHSGWPIGRDELEPYLARALPHIGGELADNELPDVLAQLPDVCVRADPTGLRPYAWSYSRDDEDPGDFLRLGRRARREHLPGVECYLHATVTSIDTDPSGTRVERLEVCTPDRGRRWVRAAHVVLCAGGIENARLMLASRRIRPEGVGNRHDVVGRYLMDHPRGPVGHFRPEHRYAAQRALGGVRLRVGARRVTVTPGMALAPEVQEAEGLLNCALWITADVRPDDPMQALRRLARGQQPVCNAFRAARHPLVLAESVARVLRGRTALMATSSVALLCMVEQRPDRDSRLVLADRTDALGVPLSRIDWRISAQEGRTVRRATQLVISRLVAAGAPEPELLPEIADASAPLGFPDVAHPTGTTRMATDPRWGVVDEHCAVHGVRGLHAVGSSVFPTSGHANPTQMIAALAVRLADRLKSLHRAG